MDINVFEQRLIKIEKDVDTLFERTNNSAIQQATINEKLNNILVTLGELKNGLVNLQQKPGEKWEKVSIAVIVAAATAITGFFIGKFF